MIFNFGTGVHDVNRPWRLQVQLNSIWYRYAVIRSCCSRYRCRCCFFSITLLRDLMNNFCFCFAFFSLFLCLICTTCKKTIAALGFHAVLFVYEYRETTQNRRKKDEQYELQRNSNNNNRKKCIGNSDTRAQIVNVSMGNYYLPLLWLYNKLFIVFRARFELPSSAAMAANSEF